MVPGISSPGSLTICINVYLTSWEPSYIPTAFAGGLVVAAGPAEAFLGCLLCAPEISNAQKNTSFPEEWALLPADLDRCPGFLPSQDPALFPCSISVGELANLQHFVYLVCCQKCF